MIFGIDIIAESYETLLQSHDFSGKGAHPLAYRRELSPRVGE
jgi:hypothetical protein